MNTTTTEIEKIIHSKTMTGGYTMKEKNIRELAKRMGLITVENMCQYTIAQLVVMVANKVNELVGEVWRFETDVQEILKTQNEKIQHLLDEGLQLEVENIFDGWLQDGTFDTLINQSALKKVNDRIDDTIMKMNEKANFKDENTNGVLIAPFFNSSSDTSVNLFMSSDGYKFKKISDIPMYGGRDSSIIYDDGYFYVLTTGYNPHDFCVRRSANLRDWQQINVSCGIYDPIIKSKLWAGEWFKDDDGKVYIFISVRNGTALDITNREIDSFETWVIDCDLKKMQFTNPRKVELENRNKIDAFVIKKDGVYLMFIKDEVDKKLEKWRSLDLINWVQMSDEIDCFDGDYVEGPSITKFNGKYYLYVDKFMEPFTYVSESTDLINFTKAKPINITEMNRHATIINVTDKHAKMILNDFINSNNPQEREFTKMINLTKLVDENNVIEKLTPREGFIYQSFSANGDIIINSIDNGYDIDKFYIILRSGYLGSITIKSGSGIEIPTHLKISPSLGNADMLIEFVWVKDIGKFKMKMPINEMLFSNQAIRDGYKRIALNSLPNQNGVITNFTPDNGALYVATGEERFSIESIVNDMPNGTRFFLGLFSSSSVAKIILKSGTNLYVPNGEFVISKDNNRNELIYEVVKCADTSFRLRGN